MAAFLGTTAASYHLEELIKSASDRLVLISPYLKINARIKELIEDKNRLKIDVRIVYGKNELQPDELNWLSQLSFVRTSFCKNLHAKCYLNESTCIITSLNLYEFSQVNNNEMGILITRENDASVYQDALAEAQRIIRISEQVRISAEHVEESSNNPAIIDNLDGKISSSKLAKSFKMKTPELLERLAALGYLAKLEDGYELTDSGVALGAESKKSRFGSYFAWPGNLQIE